MKLPCELTRANIKPLTTTWNPLSTTGGFFLVVERPYLRKPLFAGREPLLARDPKTEPAIPQAGFVLPKSHNAA
jgi:hypothetical protein